MLLQQQARAGLTLNKLHEQTRKAHGTVAQAKAQALEARQMPLMTPGAPPFGAPPPVNTMMLPPPLPPLTPPPPVDFRVGGCPDPTPPCNCYCHCRAPPTK